MICSKCGFVAKDNDRFCIRCGSPLRMPEPPAKEPEAVKAPEAPAPEPEIPVVPEVPETPEVPEVPEMIRAEELPAEPEAAPAAPAPEPVREAPAAPVIEDPPMPEVPVEPVKAEEPVIPAPVVPAPVVPAPAPVKEPEVREAAVDCADCRMEKPLSVWGYIWRIVFFSIPVLCIIPLFIMAFSSGINKNSKHFAAAVLILKLIAVLAGIGILIYILLTTEPTVISDYINQTLEKLRGMAN